MTTRLLLDEMYPPALAEILRERGHDVTAVAALPGLVGADDATVFAAARTEQRCVVTENVRDFAVLARQGQHAGVLFAHARRWPRTRPGLAKLADALDTALGYGRVPGPGAVDWLT